MFPFIIRSLKVDLEYSSLTNDLLNSSAFEVNATLATSIVDNGESQLPYEIPNCPAGSRLSILYSYPDSAVEPILNTPIDKLLGKIFPVIFATWSGDHSCSLYIAPVKCQQ